MRWKLTLSSGPESSTVRAMRGQLLILWISLTPLQIAQHIFMKKSDSVEDLSKYENLMMEKNLPAKENGNLTSSTQNH